MRIGSKVEYAGVLDIPEAEVGGYGIRHLLKEPGASFQIHNFRTAFMGQHATGCVRYEEPTRWHELYSKEHGTWMSDLPIEQAQHDRELARMMLGSVLVGGLGLGYAVTVLARRRGITSIVVVEKSKEVIALVADAMLKNIHRRYGRKAARKIEVVHADLFDYLRHGYAHQVLNNEFDHGFYDIWQSDGERTFHDVVLPLRRLSEGRTLNEPVCWNEDVMRGQLRNGLETRLMLARALTPKPEGWTMETATIEEMAVRRTGKEGKWWNWRVPFFRWVRDGKVPLWRAQVGAAEYARLYGMRRWRECWKLWAEIEGRRFRG